MTAEHEAELRAIARDMASIWGMEERLAFLSLELAYVKGERAGIDKAAQVISGPLLRERDQRDG